MGGRELADDRGELADELERKTGWFEAESLL